MAGDTEQKIENARELTQLAGAIERVNDSINYVRSDIQTLRDDMKDKFVKLDVVDEKLERRIRKTERYIAMAIGALFVLQIALKAVSCGEYRHEPARIAQAAQQKRAAK